jgi:1-deoxy-D-xylulose-5-phosphate reductoisomerase
VDFYNVGALTFEKPDYENFPCLGLAYDALRAGGTMPAVCSAANESAVELFLKNAIAYTDIPALIEYAMQKHCVADDMSIDNIFEADKEAREIVRRRVGVF